jgi:hypothetical protein
VLLINISIFSKKNNKEESLNSESVSATVKSSWQGSLVVGSGHQTIVPKYDTNLTDGQ